MSSHASLVPLLSQTQNAVYTLLCPEQPLWQASVVFCYPAERRTFGQRHTRGKSALKGTQWGTGMDECLNEMQCDSTSVDDWSVNRDVPKAYRSKPAAAPAVALGLYRHIVPVFPLRSHRVCLSHE